MLITLCMLDEKLRGECIRVGGDIRRSVSGLIDVQFNNHTLNLNKKTLDIRNCDTHERVMILNNEYASIDIR